LISQLYGDLLRRNIPVNIAAHTTVPDHDHGDLIAHCTSGTKDEADRELIRQLFAEDQRPQKLKAKLTLPVPCSIIEGKMHIRDGKEPGLVWLSIVVFSKDRLHAMVWTRNYCGILCGGGSIWKLDLTTNGWRIAGNVPNCGFIS